MIGAIARKGNIVCKVINETTKPKPEARERLKPMSLAPLTFDEAMEAIIRTPRKRH